MLIAEGRALRPNDFVGDHVPASSHPTENCPFCRGHEHLTPHELAALNDSQGTWRVRVVPNKYPAVGVQASACSEDSLTAELRQEDRLKPGLQLTATAPLGIHEVIIESPRHVLDWTELATEELTLVLRMFCDRLQSAVGVQASACSEDSLKAELQQEVRLKPGLRLVSGLIFKNVGEAGGASLEHVHSQLVALPFVPEVLDRELGIAAEHHRQQGQCLMCRLLADELEENKRLVVENSHYAVICAYAGRQPYEMWIAPKSHCSHFTELNDEESYALATIFKDTLRLLSRVLAPLAYNLVLHTAPVDDARARAFHWHWELVPRSTSLAGFEWGTGMHINSLSPERAAIRLKSVKFR